MSSAEGHESSSCGCVAVHRTTVAPQHTERNVMVRSNSVLQCAGSDCISSNISTESVRLCSLRASVLLAPKQAFRNCTRLVSIISLFQRSVRRCGQYRRKYRVRACENHQSGAAKQPNQAAAQYTRTECRIQNRWNHTCLHR